MFEFLSNQNVLAVFAILFCIGMVGAICISAYAISAGERLSFMHKYILGTYYTGFIVMVVLRCRFGYGEIESAAYALYAMIASATVLFIAAYAFSSYKYRNSQMEKAYKEYDALVKKGHRPCLVMSFFSGPKVIPAFPAHLHTNVIMWADKGVPRAYATTTLERLYNAFRY